MDNERPRQTLGNTLWGHSLVEIGLFRVGREAMAARTIKLLETDRSRGCPASAARAHQRTASLPSGPCDASSLRLITPIW